ncbi:xin actin-binding repeat-containing protein 1 [Vombatus ursinus]|uniref:xin actin-binding repeat-containing protein 1 n=1 Tax=Vombatus ursinus TaxID=29139 RepID=UPI000FFDBB15|nr:xin actin-binding repeat-containing protein 1 [Vombatus ursinus]
MAEGKVQASPAMTFPKTGEDTLALPPPPAQDELPLPPPKEAFSKFYQQRQANELRRLYRHIHPELRKNLEEAVVKDLAEVLEAEDPTEGDVQSMRWIFENWSLDAIGDHAPPQRLTDSEAVPAGDVRATSKKFEDGSFGTTDQAPAKPGPIRGDVQTVRWLFETRPMDTLTSQTDIQKAVLREPPPSGDVQGTRTLFETKPLDSLGCQPSTQEQSPLQLRSEIQELKGDVKKTVKLFQTEPLCAIQDAEGGIHEVKAACREEIQSTAVRTARWLFETRPLDAINRDPSQVRVIRGISLEEAARPDISNTRWLFETQPLDSIREVTIDEKDFQPSPDLIPPGPDVQQQRMLFETRALDTLKGEEAPEGAVTAKEEVIGGDVRSTLWLFETQALGPPSSKVQVGRLQQVGQRESEKGDSEIAGLELEKCPGGCASKMALSQLPAGDKEGKGDVKAFKKLFETLPLDSIGQEKAPVPTEESKLTGVVSAGQVQASQALFEKWPLYAIQDGQGGLHALTSVSREQVVGGDVQGFRWMFETQPLDRLGQDPEKVDVIRGITREEVMAGDVSSARWLFETQPLEVIHQQKKEKEGKEEEPPSAVPPKCNVQTIRWLFETHPLHALAGESRPEVTGTGPQADVRSYTWMFETQPREGPEGPGEQHLQVRQASLHTKDQQMEAHIFETEPLLPPYKLGGKDPVHYCSRVEIPVGQVSRRKEVFEAPEVTEGQKGQLGPVIAPEPVMGGSVRKFTWLFENCPMDCLEKAASGGIQEMPPEKDAAPTATSGKRFVFETCSLGELPDDVDETELQRIEKKTLDRGLSSSQTLRFESQPLYVLPDRQGQLHEVTAVKKEEIWKADTCGARWIFETRPLTQRLGAEEEIFVLRAVTQEDICQGELKAARWKFETEPLEPAASAGKDKAPRYVRTVSMSDVQQGNVRTSTWLFENRPLDSLKGGESEGNAEASATPEPALSVQRQDSCRGDVKRCTWLFETQPLDQLQEPAPQDEVPREKLPQADVKSTTWLFESTPLDQLHDSVPGKERPREQVPQADVKGTTRLFESKPLDHLNAQPDGEPEQRETASGEILTMLHGTPGVLQRGGILIEAHTARTVRMAKYQLPSPGKERPQVQKEEVVLGELPRILRRVMQGPDVAPQGLLVQKDEAGLVKLEPLPLSALMDGSGHKVWDLLAWSHAAGGTRTGLVIQETEQGLVKLLVYSLRLQLGSQAASGMAERGSVQLLASCIEKGDLDSLKSLQWEPPTDNHSPAEGTATPSQTPLTASSAKKVIHVALPEGGIGCAKSTGPTSTQLLAKEAWVSPGPQGQGKHGGAQKAPATLGDPQGAPSVTPEGPGPDLQVAMQNLRRATAEAQTLQHQVQSKHRPRNVPSAREPPQNGQTQEPAPQSSPAPRISRVVMPDIQMTSLVRSKVSASQEAPTEGSLRGRVAVQDGIYTAKPVRTFMPRAGAPPANGELEAMPQPGAPTPPSAGGPEVGSGPGGEGSRGCVQAALESLGKANMNVCKGDIRAALIYQDAARRVSVPSPSQTAGPSQPALNDFPPPPAAVTGPEFSPLPGPEDSTLSRAPTPQKPYAPVLSPVSGQRPPERPEAESPKQETTVMVTRKKPALPPKPAHLGAPAQILPPKHAAVTGTAGEAQSLMPPRETSGYADGPLSGRPPPSLVPSASKTSEKEVVVNSGRAMGPRGSPCTPATLKDDPAPLQGPRGLPRQESKPEPETNQQKPGGEIPQGHVQGAREIFENLKKQQELQAILSRVKAIEEDAVRGVDVKALQSLFEAVPEWVGKRPQTSDSREACPGQASTPGPKGVSSVELAFGDLARASAEVACLKEQTLARLLDIEKAIRKALSSVSSLKPEADIVALSGLLGESLGEEPSTPAPRESSIAEVSIQSSSKVKSEQTGPEGREQAQLKGQAEAEAQAKAQDLSKVESQASVKAQPRGLPENLRTELGIARVLPARVNSPSSPSFITIESAARKPAESPSPRDSPDTSHLSRDIAHSLPLEGIPADRDHREVRQGLGQSEPSPGASPLFPRRQKSVLELQTGPRGSQLYGATRTVTEQYEEVDPFGNKIITSSTTVTKQADGPASRGHGYEVGTSPLLRRYLQSTSRANGTLHEAGMVCVTFGNSRPTTK